MIQRKSLLYTLSGIMLVIGLLGWAAMWVTEEAIWSFPSRRCEAYSLISLKGQVYRTCSYLAFRYRAGEFTFLGTLMVGMIAHWLDRRHAKKRLILPDDVSSSADRDGG
jgi:hypothetical protein